VSANLKNPFWQTEYLLYKRSAGIITINQISKLRLIELGFDQEFIHVIPCGVDVPELLLEKECKETVHCLAVGRMTAKKGPILTLDAFRRALEAYPNLELDYIGEGELYPAAEQYVKAFNIADKVTFHPLQPHNIVCEYMKRADIFLQHSIVNPIDGDEEGLPVAILEAMSYGVPVVSTRHAGIPEAVVDGVTGYLVAEGDSVDMGNKISSLALNRNQRVVMGRNSWIRAKDYFSWESERAKLLRVLGIQVEDLISPNAGTSFANAQPSTISS
jgi:glycosyltransferase involved in cell wall biosynthesis